MADGIEEKENYNFSVSEASLKDSDTEVVIRREILDTFPAPDDEINAKLAEDFDHGFKNWTNTFGEDRESHIETVEENTSIGHERLVRQENTGTADCERITQYETRTKLLEKDSVKSPQVEFRHRYLQQQQLQQQQEEQESSKNEDAKMLQSNNRSSKSMEEKVKINRKQEVPSIKQTASEDKLHDGFTSKSAIFIERCYRYLRLTQLFTSHCSEKQAYRPPPPPPPPMHHVPTSSPPHIGFLVTAEYPATLKCI